MPSRNDPAMGRGGQTTATVRPMEAGDVAGAVQLSADAFSFGIDDDTRGFWEQRVSHPLHTDPAGAFIAESEGRLVGVAQALDRDGVWVLTLLTVAPGSQSSGAGRSLLERTFDYGLRSAPGLIVSSNDPRAMRLYAGAGFSLLPTLESSGSLDRSSLPRPDSRVGEAGEADLEALQEISRAIRGGTHTPDLRLAIEQQAVLLRFGDDGFAVVMPGHGIWMLAARDEQAAQTLLWHGLELIGDSERAALRWITGGQRWAIDVLVQAGFGLTAYGALAVRGRPGPLCPYIPSGPFG
jgi:ribosomal protein S18 acetylase RimI-like enzyme